MFNTVFYLVSFSFKFCCCSQESDKDNSDFLIIENIRVTISIDGTFTHLQNSGHLKAQFDKTGKPLKFCFANLCFLLRICQ